MTGGQLMNNIGTEQNLEFTEVVAVRHGLTDANLGGILQGQYDSQLDSVGIRQAELLATRLLNEQFSVIYSSDLSRARDTAGIIAELLKMPVISDPAWREWHLGDLENTSYIDTRRLYPQLMDAFKYDADDIPIPSDESKKNFYARIGAALEAVAARHPRQRILIVTHGGALQAMLKHIMGAGNAWNFLPRSSNTGYSKFVRLEKVWQLCCWNDVSHLEGMNK
jgi:broad specificity phosphatase PhoE